MKELWYPVWKDVMRGELSPFSENRELTPVEALVDLVDIASSGGRWTVDLSNRSLGRRWKWEHHKVARFLERLETMGKIRRPTDVPPTPQVMPHLIVIPPSSYKSGRPTPYPTNAPPTPHPHYNRKRDIGKGGLFQSGQTAAENDSAAMNPKLESGGGVRGLVSPWVLQQLGGNHDNGDGEDDS